MPSLFARRLSSLLFLSTLSGALQAEEAPPPPPVAVHVEVVQTQDTPIRLEYPGRTAGYRAIEVRAQVGGILQKRTFDEGAAVQAGQLLFKIDPVPYETALTRAKAAQAQVEARLRQSERDLKRIQALAARDFASARELDAAISNYEQDKADLMAAQAEVKTRQIDLDYTTVRAPIAGITSRETRSEGSLVIANDADFSLLTRITQLDPLYVNFSLPQDSLGTGLRADLASGRVVGNSRTTLSVEVLRSDGSLYPQKGSLDFTDSLVDESTGSISARVRVPNPEQRLLPGEFVRIRINGLSRPNTISIPERAVLQDSDGTYVQVVNTENLPERRAVVLGATTQGRWLVVSGLQNGERVIVEGNQKLHGPSKVEPQILPAPEKSLVLEEIRR